MKPMTETTHHFQRSMDLMTKSNNNSTTFNIQHSNTHKTTAFTTNLHISLYLPLPNLVGVQNQTKKCQLSPISTPCKMHLSITPKTIAGSLSMERYHLFHSKSPSGSFPLALYRSIFHGCCIKILSLCCVL